MILHEIFRVVSRFYPLHFMLYRGKSISFGRVHAANLFCCPVPLINTGESLPTILTLQVLIQGLLGPKADISGVLYSSPQWRGVYCMWQASHVHPDCPNVFIVYITLHHISGPTVSDGMGAECLITTCDHACAHNVKKKHFLS